MVVVVKGRGCINGDGMVGVAIVVMEECNQDLTLEINHDLTYDEIPVAFLDWKKKIMRSKTI